MLKLLGKKLGMTSLYDGTCLIPVTKIEIFPATVSYIKTIEKEGYSAIQLGAYTDLIKKPTKPLLGHSKKTSTELMNIFWEIKNITEFSLGSTISIKNIIEKAFKSLNVSGLSIGKGFTGNIKRHNFSRGPMSHGSKHHRLQGSLGAGTTPSRVFPGKKMSGHSGNEKVTIQNLSIIKIENNFIYIKGSVPGKKNNLLYLSFK